MVSFPSFTFEPSLPKFLCVIYNNTTWRVFSTGNSKSIPEEKSSAGKLKGLDFIDFLLNGEKWKIQEKLSTYRGSATY